MGAEGIKKGRVGEMKYSHNLKRSLYYPYTDEELDKMAESYMKTPEGRRMVKNGHCHAEGPYTSICSCRKCRGLE